MTIKADINDFGRIGRNILRALYENVRTRTTCNICGHDEFREGPGKRLTRTGKLPACTNCGSLERHRIVRRVYDCFPTGCFRSRKALQFSVDESFPTIERGMGGRDLGASPEISVYGGRNSLDLQSIDLCSGTYDIVICNHVLEHVENDERAFREIFRILNPDGFLQFTVPAPNRRAATRDWGFADPNKHGHFRVYGRDLVHRFSRAQPGVYILEVDVIDPVTGVSDFVYFCSMARHWMDRMKVLLDEFPMRLYAPGGS